MLPRFHIDSMTECVRVRAAVSPKSGDRSARLSPNYPHDMPGVPDTGSRTISPMKTRCERAARDAHEV
jgi:hypothetical protein